MNQKIMLCKCSKLLNRYATFLAKITTHTEYP